MKAMNSPRSTAKKSRRTLGVTALVLGLATVVTDLGATDTQTCVTEHARGQQLRQRSELRAARKAFITCASEGCPTAIAKECGQWLGEVQQSQPTVVFDARLADGTRLSDVRVLMDGELLVTALDGTAIEVDPGAHVFRFERPGAEPVQQRLTIYATEKGRRIQVLLRARSTAVPHPPGPVQPPVAGPQPPPPGPTHRPVPVAVYVLGAIGIVSLGGFIGFAAAGQAQRSKLDECKPYCEPDQYDEMATRFAVADVLLGVSAVSLVTATVLLLTRPEVLREPTQARGRGGAWTVAQGLELTVDGRFGSSGSLLSITGSF